MCSGNAEIFCNALRRECRYHTWYKCCVIHHADTDDFHRKDGSGNRSAKQSGKTGAHAAHNHNTRVFVIKVQELGKKVAKRTADLQCRTFTSRRTAAEVCQQGGKNN